MDMRLGARATLRSMRVQGWREGVRALLRVAVIACVGWAAVALSVGSHRVAHYCGYLCTPTTYDEPHRLWDDFGMMPALVLAIVAGLHLVAWRRGLVAGIVAGIASVVIGLGLGVALVASHWRTYALDDTLDAGGALSLIICFGILQLVVEPLLAISERRAREATEPVFPGAIARRA